MPPGVLPKPTRVRRNPPTIPTTLLPAGGRKGPTPRPPSWVELGKTGLSWWRWAWKTPAAAAWSTNDHPVIAARAALEDDLFSLRRVKFNGLDLAVYLEQEADAATESLRCLIADLQALAGDKLRVQKAALDLDDRLGLNPKAMAALRWTIGPDEAEQESPTAPSPTRRRLRAVDPTSVSA